MLNARKSLGEAKTAELLEALKNTAAQFGANIRTGSGTKSEVIVEERESIAASLLEGLTKKMNVVVKSADPQFCNSLG